MLTSSRSTRGSSSSSRREEILSCARRLIAEKGVRGMSIRDLARAVGFTEGALYRHFTSKEELVTELFLAEASRLDGWLSHGASSASDPWERLDALVEGFLSFAIEQPDSYRLIVEIHDSGRASVGPGGRLPRELFIEALNAIAAIDRSKVVDPGSVVLMLVGMLSRLAAGLRQGTVRLSRSELTLLAKRVARAVVGAVLAKEVVAR